MRQASFVLEHDDVKAVSSSDSEFVSRSLSQQLRSLKQAKLQIRDEASCMRICFCPCLAISSSLSLWPKVPVIETRSIRCTSAKQQPKPRTCCESPRNPWLQSELFRPSGSRL